MEPPPNDTGSTTRLMITSMVLENFKSYAGEQEIGPFHKRFSSVVGPNGSGKSNVIDALLFVFGKRAKQLRLNKVSELIHRSSRFPDLEYAKVAVHFQLIIDDENSEDDFEVVPGSEFVVSRIAFKNNQSKYSVDGKNSTYTEVGALLRKYHIDLDNNRFLILQGEVEQIAMMKPKGQTAHEDGLLEYLEDIIGSNRYVEPIAEAAKAVDDLNETRLERVKRLQIAQSDRESLEGPRAEAQEYLEKEAAIRHKQNILYQHYVQECSRGVEGNREKLQGYQERLQHENGKLKDTEAQLKLIDKQYAKSNAEYERLNAEMQQTADDFTAYERRDTKMIEDMKYLKAQMAKFNATIKKEGQKEVVCTQEAEKARAKIEALQVEIAAIETRKEAAETHLDEVMSSLQESTATLRAELEEVQIHLTEADRAVSVLQTEKEGIDTALDLVQSRSQTAQKALHTAEARLGALESEEQELGVKRAAAAERLRTLGDRTAVLTASLEQLRNKQQKLQTSVRAAVAESEEAKATQQAQQTTKKASSRAEVQSILKQARPGGVLENVGVRGRLGDLGTIPAQYDTAISTACGHLDFIVVDTAGDAEACMAYLRDTNIGRASFIVLEKLGQSAAKMDACPRVPDGTSRLFDLVQPKEAIYRPAFYVGLKDTLVTDDWDLATRVAYEGSRVKWRIVTTAGNLIDTSGAMTGGGKVARSGGMSAQSAQTSSETTITQEQIDRLESTVTRLQRELATCRGDITATEKELKETEQQLKKAAIETEKSDLQLTRLLGEREDLSSRIASLRSSCELSAEEKQSKLQAEAQLADVLRRMEESSPDRANLQDRVRSLQQQILDVGGPKLKRAQSKVDSANSEYDASRSSLSAAEVSVSSLAKQAAKASTAREKAEAELQKSQEKWSLLEGEQRDMEAEAEKVLLAQEEAKVAAQAKEEELKEISAEFKRLEEVKVIVQGVKVDLANNVEKVSKMVKEDEEKLRHWSKELQRIRTQHLEEMREYRSFVDAGASAVSASPGGEEETKGEVVLSEEVVSGDSAHKSLVVVSLKELTEEDLESVFAGLVSASQSSGRVAKGRVKKSQQSLSDDEDVDEDESTEGDTQGAVGRREGVEVLKREINFLEADRDRLKATVNLTALTEYRKKDEDFRGRLSELEEVTGQRNAARKEYEDLRRKRLEEFMSGFGTITLKLKEMYQMITLGGDAELELVDSLDPFSEGIVFSVRPPKKSWKNISNLSGGEKTLSSLALVFALHHYKPTPLYVMDEIDAALDFKNVSIVANYIKDRTKNAQFVIISLRNNMFELANRLVGIYKTHDTTKSVTINPRAFEGSLQEVAVAQESKQEEGPRKKAARTTSSTASSLGAKVPPSEQPAKVVLGDSTNLRP